MPVLELQVNGSRHRVEADADESLLSVLRDDLDLTGTKYGCGEGQCGACTVLLDGQPVRSCLTPAASTAGKPITTIEGLERRRQAAPAPAGVPRRRTPCSAATARPGMIMAGVGAAASARRSRRRPRSSRAMDGNICRCGTYPRIVAAIRAAAAGASAKRGSDADEDASAERLEPDDRARARALRARRRSPYRFAARPPRLPPAPRRRSWCSSLAPTGSSAGVGPGADAPKADAERDRRLAAHRRGRQRHRLHRQGRGRPEHPHVAGAGRRRGAARAARVDPAGDGRHRPRALRHGAPSAAARRRRWPRSSARPPPRRASCCSTWRRTQWKRRRAPRSTSADGKVDAPADEAASLGFGELTKGQKLVRDDRGRRRRRPRPSAGRSPAARSPKVDGRAFVTGEHTSTRSDIAAGRACCTARCCGRRRSARSWPRSTRRSAEALPGVTVVRDGDFVGVAAPTTHDGRARARPRSRPSGSRPPQPSGRDLFEYFAGAPEHGAEAAAGRGGGRTSAARSRTALAAADAHARGDLHDRLHRPRPARAARRGRASGRTASSPSGPARSGRSACAASWPRRFGLPEDKVRVIVPDTGSGYGGKHTGEAAIEAARLAQGGGQAGQARLDPRGGVHLGLLPPGRRDRGEARAPQGRHARPPGSSTTTTPAARRSARPTTSPNQRIEFHAGRLAAAAGLVPRPGRRRRTTSPASRTWTSWPRAVKLDPLAFRLKNLKDARLRAVLEAAAERFGWGKAEAAAGPRLRHRRRHREGRLRRHLRRGRASSRAGDRCASCALVDGVRVRRGRQPRPPEEPGRGLRRHGPGRRAVRGDRVRRTARSSTRASRATACRASATCRRIEIGAARPQGPAVGGRRRDADRRHRPGDRQRDLRGDGPAPAVAAAGAAGTAEGDGLTRRAGARVRSRS